jgi:tetratricopeptide (TPR) repeat protein
MNKNFLCIAVLLGFMAAAWGQAEPPATAPALSWKELLQAKQHAQLDAHIGEALQVGLADLAAYRQLRRSLAALVAVKPASAAPFDEWVAASRSGAALLARAEFHMDRAWKARGTEFAYKTHDDAFARMNQLMVVAQADYQEALAKLGRRCDLCWAGLLQVRLHQGERVEAAKLLDGALHELAGGIATPRIYLSYLEPRWGGNRSEMERFVERFAADFPGAAALPLLRSSLLLDRSVSLTQQRKYEQSLLLAQQAAAIDPGNSRAWEQVAVSALESNREALVLDATERALAIDPDMIYPLTARASALLKSKTPLEAVPFLERGVALGDEWSLKALLPIVAAGQHGFKPDRERAERVCQSAIDALMPAGFACMGGLSYFGIGRPADKAKARQWFLEAAERGASVAMVDAGIMLLGGVGGPPDRERAIALLLKAREAGEPRADGQLRGSLSQTDYWLKVTLADYRKLAFQSMQDNRAQTRALIAIGVFLAGSLFFSFLYKSGGRPARRFGNLRQLRAGWLLRLLAVFNVLVVLGGGYAVQLARLQPQQRLWAWAAIGLLLAGALYLAYRVFLTRVSFDDFAVYYESPLLGKRTIRFQELAETGWSWALQCDYIASTSGEKIYVSQMLEGYEELGEALAGHFASFPETQPA